MSISIDYSDCELLENIDDEDLILDAAKRIAGEVFVEMLAEDKVFLFEHLEKAEDAARAQGNLVEANTFERCRKVMRYA